MTTPRTAATIPNPGHGITHTQEDVRDVHCLGVLGFQVQVHHVRKVVDGRAAHDYELERVAQQIHRMMVAQEAGVVREDIRLLRLLDVALQDHESVFSGEHEEVIHRLEQFEERLLLVGVALEQSDAGLGDLDRRLMTIADDYAAGRGSADDDELGVLHQGGDLALVHCVAGQYADDHYSEPYQYGH